MGLVEIATSLRCLEPEAILVETVLAFSLKATSKNQSNIEYWEEEKKGTFKTNRRSI